MGLNLKLPEQNILKPKITIMGFGGAGGNAINNMIESGLQGVNFVAANTDAQALDNVMADVKIQLGAELTKGLGAGSLPEVGRAATEESIDAIKETISDSNMIFIIAGMGGGTGTGAAPVVSKLAKEMEILEVAIVTKPFHFEGKHRMRVAELGLEEVKKYVNTLITVPNQHIFRLVNETTTFIDSFKLVDNFLCKCVNGITTLMTFPGHINLDFADIKVIMSESGKAIMGIGESSGENRALNAAESAIYNPVLDKVSMKSAKGVLINITGNIDMTLFEIDAIINRIRDEVDDNEANIIFGSSCDHSLGDTIRVTILSTGIDDDTLSSSGKTSKREKREFNAIADKDNLTDSQVSDNDVHSSCIENAEEETEFFDSGKREYTSLTNEKDHNDVRSHRSGRLFDMFSGVIKSQKVGVSKKSGDISSNKMFSNSDLETLEIPAFIRRKKNLEDD